MRITAIRMLLTLSAAAALSVGGTSVAHAATNYTGASTGHNSAQSALLEQAPTMKCPQAPSCRKPPKPYCVQNVVTSVWACGDAPIRSTKP